MARPISKQEMKYHDKFFVFRNIYNQYQTIHSDCEVAFNKAREEFVEQYGSCPFKGLDDYMMALFQNYNGFRLLN